MLNYTSILYDNENTPAADNGTWTGAWMVPQCRDERWQIPVFVEIIGTATIVIEGLDVQTLNTAAIPLNAPITATAKFLLDSKTQIRVRVTSATAGAKVRVTIDGQLLYLTADARSVTGIG
jgi:hypothetical protein